ncbi:MAG TPA: sulfatase [Pirellulales bacterium]|jgi:arylsulfatase A-like enzyme|nr:sulfatase [Pirellulales bacterium]
MKTWLRGLLSCALVLASTCAALAVDKTAAKRPNIVWIFVDDMSPNFSCYGETTVSTPRVDAMAATGTKFTRAFVTAPVCSPCRSALITGMYQTSIGSQNHRSGRGTEKIHLPQGVEPVPVLFQRAGYYTCIGGSPVKGTTAIGKTDYNFEWDEKMYDGTDWSGRQPGQPFFMQVQLSGGKHRHGAKWTAFVKKELGSSTPPEKVTLPHYYPRDPVILDDWAQYLDAVRYTDYEVGLVLDRLEKEGLADSTIVCFMTDHGISHARGKQFLYDEGTHVPLVIRGPGIAAGKVRTDLVEQIDLAALSLALAGIAIPASMQGRDILATSYKPRDAVFAARDRCDETIDHIRSVRTDRYKYIRNFLPKRPHLQPNRYKDAKQIVQRLRELHAEHKLDAVQELLFAPERAPEELYDLTADPHEINNLAGESAYQSTLLDLRGRLDRWMAETGDLGREPESTAMYDSDMAEYLRGHKRGTDALESNIRLMKRWAAEGK